MVAARLMRALLLGLLLSVGPAWGQDKGSVNPVPLPPLPNNTNTGRVIASRFRVVDEIGRAHV